MLKRSYMTRKSYQWKRTAFRSEVGTNAHSQTRERPKRASTLKACGRRTNDWRKAWRFLKPRLEAAGRTGCEFRFVPHVCSGILDPAHSKKRREMEGSDIYAVAIACRNFHDHLDLECSHEEMESLVMEAIERAGGLILPEIREAA